MLTYNKLVPETLQTCRIAARKVHVEMSDARAPAHQRDGVVAATASAQCARAELPSSKSATASVSTTAQHNPLSGGGLPASKARHGPEHFSVEFYREGVKSKNGRYSRVRPSYVRNGSFRTGSRSVGLRRAEGTGAV